MLNRNYFFISQLEKRVYWLQSVLCLDQGSPVQISVNVVGLEMCFQDLQQHLVSVQMLKKQGNILFFHTAELQACVLLFVLTCRHLNQT